MIYKQESEERFRTEKAIMSLIDKHVKAVNKIYENADEIDKKFVVYRIKFHDSDSNCGRLCDEHIDVAKFLNEHSKDDHSEFCLSYVFTAR